MRIPLERRSTVADRFNHEFGLNLLGPPQVIEPPSSWTAGPSLCQSAS